MLGALRSYIYYFRLLIYCIPDSALIEPTNKIEIQSGPILPYRIGRFVRDTLSGLMMIYRPSTNPSYSTSSCCIVRTVLNGGLIPDNVTYAFLVPNSSRFGLIHGNR